MVLYIPFEYSMTNKYKLSEVSQNRKTDNRSPVRSPEDWKSVNKWAYYFLYYAWKITGFIQIWKTYSHLICSHLIISLSHPEQITSAIVLGCLIQIPPYLHWTSNSIPPFTRLLLSLFLFIIISPILPLYLVLPVY